MTYTVSGGALNSTQTNPNQAGGTIALPQTPSRYKGEGREEKGRKKGLGMGRWRKGREGKEVKG